MRPEGLVASCHEFLIMAVLWISREPPFFMCCDFFRPPVAMQKAAH